jgi:hypothetical protein
MIREEISLTDLLIDVVSEVTGSIIIGGNISL